MADKYYPRFSCFDNIQDDSPFVREAMASLGFVAMEFADLSIPQMQLTLELAAVLKRAQDDIVRFKLPPLLVKDRDPRAASFKRRHGNEAVELDALPPTELRSRLRKAINGVIDRTAWDRALLVEQSQRETCVRYAEVFKQMATEMRNQQ